jgi:PhnB protein
MAKLLNYKPDNIPHVCPYLIVNDVSRLVAFTKEVFSAVDSERMLRPDGSVMHTQVRIGESVIMMGEITGDMPPLPAMLHVYVEDPDAASRRAMALGATSLQEPKDEFYGDRTAGVLDSNGVSWWMATHQEELSPEDMQRRAME